jgi:probable F420-dependent oxidoreductase
MDSAPCFGAAPAAPPHRVLAALGPRMLTLAAELTEDAHTYTVPVEHIEQARRRLGPGPLLIPEQKVVLVSDPGEARRIGRANIGRLLRMPNYAGNLRRLGFADADFADGGSDRLIDALVAWGDFEDVRPGDKEHLDAGAGHVALQVLTADPAALPLREWRELAALPVFRTYRTDSRDLPLPRSGWQRWRFARGV